MTTEFEPGDVPALRRELLDWLRDGRGLRFHTLMSTEAGSMLGRPELNGDPDVMAGYASMVVDQEIRTLDQAELYYVTAEMTEIVRAAAESMPAFPPDNDDFPVSAGLIVYETPLVTYRRTTGDNVSVGACTWGPYNAGGQWRDGGVWMSFYRPRSQWTDAVNGSYLREQIRRDVPRLIADNEYGIKFEHDPAGKEELERSLAAKDQPAYTSYWAKHLLTTLLLMRQPLVYQRAEPIRRGLRRQLERAGQPIRPIVVLDARPRRYTTVPGAAAPEGRLDADEPQEDHRKIGVRFPVRGFWRNQWYPSRSVHRPKWIDPHWRGPEDAPIVHSERVRVLRPHPDQEAPSS